MKQKFIVFFLFVIGFSLSETQAQIKQATIIDDLETFVPGEGIIQISSDTKITELIGILSPEGTNGNNYVEMSGFRIQVFMSNDQRTARKVISDKVSLIQEIFPEVTVYRGYTAPNWKLLVGDFRTKEEADVFKQKLLSSIPNLGKEMYVVSDKINIPIQRNN